jgi:hypothetical protein
MQQEADMPEKASEFVTVYHPTIEGVSNDVPTDSVDAWQAQGWLKGPPKSPDQTVQ